MSWAEIAGRNRPEVSLHLPNIRAQALASQRKEAEADLEAAEQDVEYWERRIHRSICGRVGEIIRVDNDEPMEEETLTAIQYQRDEINEFTNTEEFKFLQGKLAEAKDKLAEAKKR